jgi:hypothetical protein
VNPKEQNVIYKILLAIFDAHESGCRLKYSNGEFRVITSDHKQYILDVDEFSGVDPDGSASG